MNYTGEYYLRGVMETGCGFNIHEDSTFEFFYSYGALDRHAYGSWKEISEGEIEINTEYKNASPFTIALEEKREHAGLKVFIRNFQRMFYENSKVIIVNAGKEEEQLADKQGVFNFSSAKADKIISICIFYFDNPGTLIPADPTHNYFELEANQNLALAQFKNARYKLDGDTLIGKLHLIDDFKEYRFEK